MLDAKDTRAPEEVERAKRNTSIRKLVSMLSSTRQQLAKESALPKYLLNQMNELIEKLQDQIEE